MQTDFFYDELPALQKFKSCKRCVRACVRHFWLRMSCVNWKTICFILCVVIDIPFEHRKKNEKNCLISIEIFLFHRMANVYCTSAAATKNCPIRYGRRHTVKGKRQYFILYCLVVSPNRLYITCRGSLYVHFLFTFHPYHRKCEFHRTFCIFLILKP